MERVPARRRESLIRDLEPRQPTPAAALDELLGAWEVEKKREGENRILSSGTILARKQSDADSFIMLRGKVVILLATF